MTKNLGIVRAIHVGTTAPTNTDMLWYDTAVGVRMHKYYDFDTSDWEFLASSGDMPIGTDDGQMTVWGGFTHEWYAPAVADLKYTSSSKTLTTKNLVAETSLRTNAINEFDSDLIIRNTTVAKNVTIGTFNHNDAVVVKDNGEVVFGGAITIEGNYIRTTPLSGESCYVHLSSNDVSLVSGSTSTGASFTVSKSGWAQFSYQNQPKFIFKSDTLEPYVDNAVDLGSPTKWYRNVYAHIIHAGISILPEGTDIGQVLFWNGTLFEGSDVSKIRWDMSAQYFFAKIVGDELDWCQTAYFENIHVTALPDYTTDGFLRVSNSDGTIVVDTSSYSLSNHDHAGVYEPVITAGSASKFFSWDKTWRDIEYSLITKVPQYGEGLRSQVLSGNDYSTVSFDISTISSAITSIQGVDRIPIYDVTEAKNFYVTVASLLGITGGASLAKYYKANITNLSSGTILASDHGCGTEPAVQIWEVRGGKRKKIEPDDIEAATNGDITWYAVSAITGYILITGG